MDICGATGQIKLRKFIGPFQRNAEFQMKTFDRLPAKSQRERERETAGWFEASPVSMTIRDESIYFDCRFPSYFSTVFQFEMNSTAS